jgi:hypothetical protein
VITGRCTALASSGLSHALHEPKGGQYRCSVTARLLVGFPTLCSPTEAAFAVVRREGGVRKDV